MDSPLSIPRSTSLIRTALLAIVCAVAGRGAAFAQPIVQNDRWSVNVSVGLQLTSTTFDQVARPIIYDEPATLLTTHTMQGSTVKIDLGGAIRIAGDFGVGVSYVRYAPGDTATMSAQIPHPILINQSRTVINSPEGLQRSESALHFAAQWTIPVATRVDLVIFGGPSLVNVSQDLVTGIVLAPEAPPYAAVVISKTVVDHPSQHAWGAHVGADVSYAVTPVVGVGVTARFTRASLEVQSGGSTIDIGGGGLQVVAGARLRFP